MSGKGFGSAGVTLGISAGTGAALCRLGCAIKQVPRRKDTLGPCTFVNQLFSSLYCPARRRVNCISVCIVLVPGRPRLRRPTLTREPPERWVHGPPPTQHLIGSLTTWEDLILKYLASLMNASSLGPSPSTVSNKVEAVTRDGFDVDTIGLKFESLSIAPAEWAQPDTNYVDSPASS